jgi:hypothetical protein
VVFLKVWVKTVKHLKAKSLRLKDKAMIDLVDKIKKVPAETKS